MTKQLQDMTNEELDRLAAKLQGREYRQCSEEVDIETRTIYEYEFIYQPTTNREQAMELQIEFGIDVHAYMKNGVITNWYAHRFNTNMSQMHWSKRHAKAPTPMRAIVLAAIPYLQEKSDE